MARRKRRREGAGHILGAIRAIVADPIRVRDESLVLVLLSIADILLTHRLLMRGTHFEANPLARWWFARWNMAGMTAFKFLVIGSVITVSEYLERRRPGYGRGVLWIGSIAAAAVVIYSVMLLRRAV